MAADIDQAPYVDIFSESFREDPQARFEAIRRTSWLARTAIGVLVIDRSQVQAILADRRFRSAVPEVVAIQGGTGELAEAIKRSVLGAEGEDHTRIRRLASRAFTPKAADRHRPAMQAIMQQLVDDATSGGIGDHCELMTAIGDHYPIQVMCHILGIPREDQDDFARWNAAMTWALSAEVGAHMADIEWGFGNMGEYVAALAADRRRQPRDDMITALVQAEEADDRLTEDEVQTLIASLLFAGHDTTRNQLGLAMWLFAEHPDQWRSLGARPELVPQAVEEVVRFAAAVNVTPRLAVEAVELDGYLIPQGTLVMVSLNGANHDPAVYAEPFTFDITVAREPINSFGGGRHYCLGASLARAELQEALKILTTAMPGLALDGEPTWRTAMGIFGPERLPLRWDAPARAAVAT